MVFVEAICRCSFKTDCNAEVEKLNALTLNKNRWIENNVLKVDKLMVLMLRNICWIRYQVADFDIYFLSWILLQFDYHSCEGFRCFLAIIFLGSIVLTSQWLVNIVFCHSLVSQVFTLTMTRTVTFFKLWLKFIRRCKRILRAKCVLSSVRICSLFFGCSKWLTD